MKLNVYLYTFLPPWVTNVTEKKENLNSPPSSPLLQGYAKFELIQTDKTGK